MLDKLHYFLPNTDESVHVYGDGRQTWVNVDGIRGYPDPEYGEGFAKFTDGTRTVIVAPWKG